MPQTLMINDLLNLSEEELNKAKIKFNQFNGRSDPMEEYKNNLDIVNNQWLFWHKKQKYFSKGQIAVCFLKLSDDKWLLTTIRNVNKELGVKDGINYEGTEIERLIPYFGRVIVKYHKNHQSQGVYLKSVINKIEVTQILPTMFDGEDFPGYESVRLSYSQLSTIINRGKKDWIAALENQKAIYLITDTHTGKLYIGSATGENGMLLQRWKNYVETGHGGNKELKEISFDYIKKYFQYSILENYNSRVDKNKILARETWWKNTLCSRQFGYNSN